MLTYTLVVLSMAEMAVAIMVVSLPSMRSYLRRGSFFSSRQTDGHSSSDHALRPSWRRSTQNRSRRSARSRRSEESSGSEVELNGMSKNVITKTHEISVESAPITEKDRFGQ